MTRYLTILVLCAIMFCTGCPAPTHEQQVESMSNRLPPQAKNIVILGDGWATFELEINGQKREFLFHRESRYDRGYESITELIPR